MAKKFGVEEWLLPACVALVERRDPINYAEAERLGLGMTVLISEAREKYTQRQRSGSSGLHSPYSQIYNLQSATKDTKDTAQLVRDVFRIK